MLPRPINKSLLPVKRLLLQLLLLCALYFLSRCLFTIINHSHFEGLTIRTFTELCFHALRFDLSAILAINALYILLLFLPVPARHTKVWDAATRYLFVITNSMALLFELSDWAYFPYNFKRSTADVLNMVSREGDFRALLPGFLADYWYVPIAALLFIGLLIYFNRKICRATPLSEMKNSMPDKWRPLWQTLLLLLIAGCTVIGIRGGLQYVPINLRNALQATESKFTPIVLNTPFSIINTLQNRDLEPLDFYPEEQLRSYINPIRDFSGKPFLEKNVVVIILESFSKEFTRLGTEKSYTPFLDSLMDHALVCTQAYANALRSSEGIPAIVSGIPSLMDEGITTSIYATNRINALPGLLRGKGYTSAFFHGGTNGTMSFDVYCAGAGFHHYFGRKEYNNERDYDGNWGIWDEPFLQYTAARINAMPQPFFAALLTLSSHPPYKIPEPYKSMLPAGDLPVYQAVAYTDMALRRFFETASTMPWFRNTLFVITADHCSPVSGQEYYRQHMGRYAIPIVYFAPGDTMLRGSFGEITQQIDILPSVLDYLGYEKPFYALGNTIFREHAQRYTINYNSNHYQWLTGGFLLKTDETTAKALYAFPADSICHYNLLPEAQSAADQHVTPYFRALLQEYRSALINNRMFAD